MTRIKNQEIRPVLHLSTEKVNARIGYNMIWLVCKAI